MKKISVIGTGYVGLVTGTCFAELGNSVACIDTDVKKIRDLRGGHLPFFEPGLSELVRRNVDGGRLTFHDSAATALPGSEVVFIAVGTPQGEDGQADLRYVRQAARDIAEHLDRAMIVVNKSTVPVETGDLVAAIIREYNATPHEVTVISNPEFLREGSAIADFMQPDRIVVGVEDPHAAEFMHSLYAPLNAPIVVTNVRTAEMIKYTANAFLATKISFINEIARVCDRVGADVKDVVLGAGSDRRIGTAFMSAGIGFGGSCFPKDVMALSKIAAGNGVDAQVLHAVLDVNRQQIGYTVDRIADSLGGDLNGRVVAVLGLAFKPNTDDIRESPAIKLIEALLERGAEVRSNDPVAMPLVAQTPLSRRITFHPDIVSTTTSVDAVVVATDWNEYKQLDLASVRASMRGDLLVDGRNLYEPAEAVAAGFRYVGIGRGRHGHAHATLALDA